MYSHLASRQALRILPSRRNYSFSFSPYQQKSYAEVRQVLFEKNIKMRAKILTSSKLIFLDTERSSGKREAASSGIIRRTTNPCGSRVVNGGRRKGPQSSIHGGKKCPSMQASKQGRGEHQGSDPTGSLFLEGKRCPPLV